MYVQMTFEDIRNATSSPESAGGASHLNSPDGRKIDPYGQEVVPASHTAQQENREETQTSETSGLPSSASLQSATLNLYLANRLKMQFATDGSIEYTQTWREKVTPSGRLYLVHTASEHHTAGTGSTGGVSAWPKTPMAGDVEGGQMEIRPGTTGKYKLRDWVAISAWPTPTSRDHKGGNPSNVPVNCLLGRAVWQVFLHGETVNSSSAGMGKLAGYRLNPFFSAWMMGFPQAWTEAGLLAFRKLEGSRSRRRKKVA